MEPKLEYGCRCGTCRKWYTQDFIVEFRTESCYNEKEEENLLKTLELIERETRQ